MASSAAAYHTSFMYLFSKEGFIASLSQVATKYEAAE